MTILNNTPISELYRTCKHCGAELELSDRQFCNRSCYFASVRETPTLRQANKQVYWVWRAMIRRCGDPRCKDWQDYGGRGINVCERWTGFANFLADMGARPDGGMLDRIDNDKGYSPGNCRWATATEQSGNRRNCIMVDGAPLKSYCREHGLPYGTITKRIREGWSVARAISEPVRNFA